MQRVFSLLLMVPVVASVTRSDAAEKLPTADYQGRPFVTQAAPILKFERRRAPRPFGIDYPFAEQTARGVTLFNRFPAFALSDRQIHLYGPWFDSEAANGHFTRGVTSVVAMPRYREGPTDIRNIPYNRKTMLWGDNVFWASALRLADKLAAQNPKDERIAPLRTFGNEHRFVPHDAATLELGRNVWREERLSLDAKGQGVLYPTIDIEGTGGWEYQRTSFGLLYRGLAEEAAKDGVKIIPQTYGQWTYEVGAVHTSTRQGGKGEPEYLLPEKDFFAAPDPTLQICNETGGALTMDGYMQAIWGNEPFYQRNADGTLRLENGKPVFNDLKKTTLYGQEFTLEPGEAEHCLQDIYRQAVRMYLMHHRLAGQYPASSDLRKPFLKNVRISAWTRYTNEGLQGIQQNDRPLPGWLIEALSQMYLFTADDLIAWSSETNTPPGPLGGDYSKYYQHNTFGMVEYVIKAAHRYSALEPLHRGDFQWCWFHLPMLEKNQTDGERPDQKPIAFGKIRTFEGKPWLELFALWPALDNQATDFKIWVDKDGRRSPAYTVRLANGRTSFYDAWQLPTEFSKLEGKHIYLQFKDLMGQARTWRGDWRVEVDDVLPPAGYRGPAT